MLLNTETCYSALQARDKRFDGRFFVGVASTGIYCRPICRAITPKSNNCSFYPSAAAAEAAGFRPCLRCRPELAPGSARVDAESRLARLAAERMECDGLCEQSLSGLAQALGITDRHLRRVFVAEYGVPPVAWLQTRRLLAAKQLLTETPLSVTQVAMDAGFGSVRRLNALFRQRYNMAPAELRKTVGAVDDTAESIVLSLGYRPPLAWESLLRFLQMRSIPGVEHVEEGAYRRSVNISHQGRTRLGWLSVENHPKQDLLVVQLSASLFPVVNQALTRLRFLFDLNCMPDQIEEKLGQMRVGGQQIFEPGMRVPAAFDPFEMAVRAILGQQITVKAARTLAMRMAKELGEPVQTPFAEVSLAFPTPEKICGLGLPVEDRLGPLGINGARARAIRALAEALHSGAIRLGPGTDPEREMAHLAQLPGIGPWTVQYLAMRGLGWPDAFPDSDYGVRKALGDLPKRDLLELARQWSPWRSYAVIALWNYLGRVKTALP